jgi:hypothetical protein
MCYAPWQKEQIEHEAYNISEPDWSTLIMEINTWFAVRLNKSQTKRAVEQRVNITTARSVCVCARALHIVVSVLPRTEVRLVPSSVSVIESVTLKLLRQGWLGLYDIPFINSLFRLFSCLHMAVFEGSINKTTVQVALCACCQVPSVGVCSVLYYHTRCMKCILLY